MFGAKILGKCMLSLNFIGIRIESTSKGVARKIDITLRI